mmetsp:Transcript_21225/g.72296  ORF Transcript_21225/g.72296 Transcript_21225/m.72296 type:complete len:331 (-) Transcript_21225:148-1140(-)
MCSALSSLSMILPARSILSSFATLSRRTTRSTFMSCTSSLFATPPMVSYGRLESMSIVNQPRRYFLVISFLSMIITPSCMLLGTARLNCRSISQMKPRSTRRLSTNSAVISDAFLGRSLVRNATSNGVTTAVNSRSVMTVKSQYTNFLCRGENTGMRAQQLCCTLMSCSLRWSRALIADFSPSFLVRVRLILESFEAMLDDASSSSSIVSTLLCASPASPPAPGTSGATRGLTPMAGRRCGGRAGEFPPKAFDCRTRLLMLKPSEKRRPLRPFPTKSSSVCSSCSRSPSIRSARLEGGPTAKLFTPFRAVWASMAAPLSCYQPQPTATYR